MTLGERIRMVRKAASKTQKDFSSDLGVSGNYVYLIESDREKPSDRTLNDICRIYGVNKDWLCTGEGEPYIEKSDGELIAQFFGEVESMDEDSLTRRFITLLASMDKAQRDQFEKIGEMIIEGLKK